MRQSLHILIDPTPYDPELIITPDSASPSSDSARLSAGTSRTTPTSSGSDQDEFSVLCMHDFRAADADQLSFRKNEILLIVKRENTGWWAAMRRGGDVIGWVPQAFVSPLTDDMAERLANVREELRLYEYRAEQLYSTPVSRPDIVFESEPEPEPRRKVSPQTIKSPERTVQGQPGRAGIHHNSVSLDANKPRKHAPPSPTTPMPMPSVRPGTAVNKPTPPTPNEKEEIPLDPSRFIRSPSMRRRIEFRGHASPDPTASFEVHLRRPRTATTAERRRPLASDDCLQPVLVLQATVPRYLKPRFADQLILDAEGSVRGGTIPALVERLLSTNGESKQYQDAFLMTFRSFMSPDALFDALVEYYNLPRPDDLTASELEDWLDRVQGRTQRKVLEIFSDWLQVNHLLEQEPNIAGRLTEFLKSITTGPNSKVSKLIQERISDLTFSIGSPITVVSPSTAARRRRYHSRPQKGDLLKIETVDIAEQLTVLLFDVYRKILPHECIIYTRSHSGPSVANLREFCASHDKVVSWVQTSILWVDTMKKRAETVDYWIKVAEKCRALNNIASMSAIITALNSTVVQRLPLTMAHVSKKSILESLSRYNDPTNSFATYRKLNNVDGGPCLPFIAMYLTDLTHIQDQFNDRDGHICFFKRRRFYDIISVMLRHQKEPYALPLDDVAVFIRERLQQEPPNERTLWKKSEDVQQSELAHADIRRGLEKAGF